MFLKSLFPESRCLHVCTKAQGESFQLVKQWHAVNFLFYFFFLWLKNSRKFLVKNHSANVKILK